MRTKSQEYTIKQCSNHPPNTHPSCPLPMQALNPFSGAGGTMRYWEEGELVDLVNSVGLTGYSRERTRMFIMFSARKPGGHAASSS